MSAEVVRQDGIEAGMDGGDAEAPFLDAGTRAERGVVDLHRAVWRWAQENRLPDGALLPGRVIAASRRY
ncbi:hypothetical protein DP939_32805 [Spongiactinospora rosea]|uniref:Uncharacterized protein n=1 Tax=Spongiactinospora rosea TaxID=2248750 RepID=A0A366LQ84_9ACTN|nr:hypothetical protein DP939_32805 [Spongiactinospora rosea]